MEEERAIHNRCDSLTLCSRSEETVRICQLAVWSGNLSVTSGKLAYHRWFAAVTEAGAALHI